jgi:O-antigen/teichoic acid export membrane protein
MKYIYNFGIKKDLFFYTIANIISAAIPFLILPVMTRFLTPSEYGFISVFSVIVTILTTFIGANMYGSISRFYFDKNKEQMGVFISSIMVFLSLSGLFFSLLIFIFGDLLSSLLFVPKVFFWYALALAITNFVIRIKLTLWEVEKKSFIYGIFVILMSLTNTFGSITFVVFLNSSSFGVIYSQLFTGLLFFLISIYILLNNRWLVRKFSFHDLKGALAFGLPLIPHILSATVISMSDRFFIASMVSIDEVGIYNVGYQIGMIINVLVVSFGQSYVPWLYGNLIKRDANVDKKIVNISYLSFISIFTLALILSIISNLFLEFYVGETFSTSTIYVFWIASGYAFHGMYTIVAGYIFYVKKTKILGFLMPILALMNIGLNLLMIPIFGPIGAAYSTTLIYFMEFLIVWIVAGKIYPMPWNFFNFKIFKL